MEANQYAFHAALHEATDNGGVTNGIGGGNFEGLSESDYGPGAEHRIDTRYPFRVHAHFIVDPMGDFTGMKLTLEQGPNSRHFTVMASNSQQHSLADGSPYGSMNEALREGITASGGRVEPPPGPPWQPHAVQKGAAVTHTPSRLPSGRRSTRSARNCL